jgi:hypothetical protein
MHVALQFLIVYAKVDSSLVLFADTMTLASFFKQELTRLKTNRFEEKVDILSLCNILS